MIWKRTVRVMTLAGLLLIPLPSVAALQCEAGLTPVNVSGNVTTLNVSGAKQVGQICLTMIGTANGREVFNACGALIGKLVSADPQTGSSVLTHTAVFDFRDIVMTANDRAQITGVLDVDETGAPCAFSVVESFSVVEKGTGFFRRSQFNATATGTVSHCPDRNMNLFSVQGEACIKK